MDAADRTLLESTVASALESHGSVTVTDLALAQLGWEDMLHYEPTTSIAVVFNALGVSGAQSSALDDVVAARLDLPVESAMIHPGWGSTPVEGAVDASTVSAVGTIGPRAATADAAHIVLGDGVATVPLEQVTISQTAGPLAVATADRIPLLEWRPIPPEQISGAVTAARLALGHWLGGLASSMLALARTHALERVQFGQPIAQFQAVRHRLAEGLVANEAANAALVAAVEDPGPLAVDLARITAGRAASETGRHCQQVLAGTGFTREHDFHRFLFGSIEIDGLYGTTTSIEAQVGSHLIETGQVPRVVQL